MAVEVATDGRLSAGTPRMLFEYAHEYAGSRAYDIASGRSFVMIQDEAQSGLTEIRIVQNWTEELKRLVPTEN